MLLGAVLATHPVSLTAVSTVSAAAPAPGAAFALPEDRLRVGTGIIDTEPARCMIGVSFGDMVDVRPELCCEGGAGVLAAVDLAVDAVERAVGGLPK